MTTTLLQQLRRLADARAEAVAVADALKTERAAFDLAHAALIADTTRAAEQVAVLEAEVRALALVAYEATADKKPALGVEVVLLSKLAYEDAKALAWAQQTKMALTPESLDKKAFEKIAKATPLPFVEYLQEPSVRIATQLNAAAYAEVAS